MIRWIARLAIANMPANRSGLSHDVRKISLPREACRDVVLALGPVLC